MAPSSSPSPDTDELACDSAARRARLQQLMEQAQKALSESRVAVAAHHAAREKMSRALHDARARLEKARSGADS